MNGRVYDYNLGRFLSVDPFIQSPGNSQSMNPYSYIMNNPLAGTDPSGYISYRDAAGGDWVVIYSYVESDAGVAKKNGKKSDTVNIDAKDSEPFLKGLEDLGYESSGHSNIDGTATVTYRPATGSTSVGSFTANGNSKDLKGVTVPSNYKFRYGFIKPGTEASEEEIKARYLADAALGFVEDEIVSAVNSETGKKLGYAEALANFRGAYSEFVPGERTSEGAFAHVDASAQGLVIDYLFEISMGGVRDIYNNGQKTYKGQVVNVPKGLAGVIDMMRHEMGHFVIANSFTKIESKYFEGYKRIRGNAPEHDANNFMFELRKRAK